MQSTFSLVQHIVQQPCQSIFGTNVDTQDRPFAQKRHKPLICTEIGEKFLTEIYLVTEDVG